MANLDDTDIAILRILLNDAGATNAAIGKVVGLSAPATFERIKRMKQHGVILGARTEIDPTQLDRNFLSFVFLKTRGVSKAEQVASLEAIPEIEEIHSTAGQFSIFLKIRTRNAAEMEELFERIYKVSGIEGSETIIAFKTFLSRPLHIPA